MDLVSLICSVVSTFQTILYTVRCQGSLRSQGQQQFAALQPLEKHNIWAIVQNYNNINSKVKFGNFPPIIYKLDFRKLLRARRQQVFSAPH